MPPRKLRSVKPPQHAAGALPEKAIGLWADQLVELGPVTAPLSTASARRPRRSQPVIYQVKVTLDDSRPPIWRRLEVRSDVMLPVLHQILQTAYHWYDGHLHRFSSGGSAFDPRAEQYLCDFDVAEGDDGIPETEVRLDETLVEAGDVLRYCYDYGDEWALTIRLESVRPDEPAAPAAVCTGGKRAAPPEDCGGLRDAYDLAEILDDPAQFDPIEINEVLLDPFVGVTAVAAAADALSCAHPALSQLLLNVKGDPVGAAFTRTLAELVAKPSVAASPDQRAEAVRPILWFLEHVGPSGLPTTAAGYLRPVDVSALADQLPSMLGWIGLRNRETQTYPVLAFREAMQAVGLLRKYRGRLLLTKAGSAAHGSPEVVWRQLVQRLPIGSDSSMSLPAGWLLLLQTAVAAVDFTDIAAAMTAIGWRMDGGRPVSEFGVARAVAHTRSVLSILAQEQGAQPFDPVPARDQVVRDLATSIVLGRS